MAAGQLSPIPEDKGEAMACEDYPCCGHEPGDCEGRLYGSDESIKAATERRMSRERWYGDNDGMTGGWGGFGE